MIYILHSLTHFFKLVHVWASCHIKQYQNNIKNQLCQLLFEQTHICRHTHTHQSPAHFFKLDPVTSTNTSTKLERIKFKIINETLLKSSIFKHSSQPSFNVTRLIDCQSAIMKCNCQRQLNCKKWLTSYQIEKIVSKYTFADTLF